MTYINFATCDRERALDYLKQVYPKKDITDTPECAGPLLDLVDRDVVRVQDPMMHGSRIAIIPGNNFAASETEQVHATCQQFASRAAALAEAA